MNKKLSLAFLGMFLSAQAFSQLKCDYLCNTDFENGTAGVTSTGLLTQFPCWKTTATDGIIESWNGPAMNVPAYTGNMFIELNATQSSTVYQDFTVAPGTPLTIGFAHRGRAGVDVMNVAIGPVGGPYTSLGNFSDGTAAWGYYNLYYTIPAAAGNNYSIRFTSVSWSGGNPAIGNFLDAVSLCGETVVTPPASTCPVCENTNVSLDDFEVLDAAGNATASFQLNSGGRAITKIRVTLLNFRAILNMPGCGDYCAMNNEDFGHFVNVTKTIPGFSYAFEPYNTTTTPDYTNQIEMLSTATPQVINGFVGFDLKFPPIFGGGKCGQTIEACFRVEFIDADCVVCDQVVCTTAPPVFGKSMSLDKDNHGAALTVYPNPNDGRFVINTSAIGADCRYQLTTLEGKEVQQGKIEGGSTEIDNTGLAQGTYILYVFRNNQVFTEKIVVTKGH
jgi:hypothetical protein